MAEKPLPQEPGILRPRNIVVTAIALALFHDQVGSFVDSLLGPATPTGHHTLSPVPKHAPGATPSPTETPYYHGIIHLMPEYNNNTNAPLYDENIKDAWGPYYNQRDIRWYYDTLGNSNVTMGRAGCLTADIAMVWSHITEKVHTPQQVNSHKDWYYPNSDAMKTPLPTLDGHKPIEFDNASIDIMHQELNAGYTLIIELKWGNGEYHYVVARGLDNGHMRINDPWFGDNLNVEFGKNWGNNNLTYRFWAYK